MPDRNSKSKLNKMDFGVIGYSGLKQYGGIINEEFLPKLRGAYASKVYREMADNSSVVGAVRYLIKALVRQVEWRVEPADPSKEALEQAQFVEECLCDMQHTFEDFISEVLSMLDYGWSYFELVYKLRRGDTKDPSTSSQYDDGKIGWRKIALRAQDTLDRWEFETETSELLGMHQIDQTTGRAAFIPYDKALLFRTETYKDNPEGRSIYRNAVIDYFFLKRISEIEAIGIERDMTGLLTMEVPVEMLHADAPPNTKTLLANLEKMLSELKRDEREFAIVPSELNPRDGKPSGYKLKLLSTGGSRQIDTNAVKLYYKTSMLQSVVAQFIQLGMANVGSFALASTQTNLFAVALGSFLDVITSTFSRFGIGRLMKFNNVPRELWPELVHGDIEAPPLSEIGPYVQSLAATGQLPEDDAIRNKLLEFAKLPIPEKDEGEGVEKQRPKGGLKRKQRVIPGPGQKTPPNYCPFCGKPVPIVGRPKRCPSCGRSLVTA